MECVTNISKTLALQEQEIADKQDMWHDSPSPLSQMFTQRIEPLHIYKLHGNKIVHLKIHGGKVGAGVWIYLLDKGMWNNRS